MSNILIMEDDKVFADLISQSLTSAGHCPIVAATGQQALEIVRQQQIDLAIIDIYIRIDGYLTNDGGLLFLTRLRRQSPSAPFATDAYIPVIAMSGAVHHIGQETLLETASTFGANRVLAKPFPPRQLMDFIDTLLPVSSSGEAG
ncbi:response regulator [Antarctobacter jejuensis]|uniref:response regulator n=1 Tax=Antarctobacter jejuensis TaxID=1439938 RepID=UPI003FD22FDC